jgi:hypothetical protein
LPPVVHTRAQLKRWIKDIWLPNAVHPVKRPASYWQRLGSVIWENYETAVDLRHRTKRAIKKEMERLAHADKRKRSKMLAARERRRRAAYDSRQHAICEDPTRTGVVVRFTITGRRESRP